MNPTNAIKYLLRALLMMTITFAISAAAQDMHTSSQFQGPKANKGHVTHSTRDGKSVLTLSEDFVVPDTPDPHWQVVDSDGQIYLLDKLKKKALLGEQVPKGDCSSRIRKERFQSDHLVCLGGSKSGRCKLYLARQVATINRGARTDSNLDVAPLKT